MKPKRLKEEHIDMQFLALLISVIAFLVFALFIGDIVWIKDFQYFIALISGVMAIFIGTLALLRYYTKKTNMNYLFLGGGFLGVGLIEILQTMVEVGDFQNLFTFTEGGSYPLSSALAKVFLASLFLISWFVIRKKKGRGRKKELELMGIVCLTFVLFVATFIILLLRGVEVDSFIVVLIGLFSLLLYILSLLGYLFKKGWLYDDFNYWIIFTLSFLILSQIFYLPFLNLEYIHMINLSTWAHFIAYVGMLVGFLNSIYMMYQREKETQQELEEKNLLLDKTKAKVEEAYLTLREEKWELVNKKGGLGSILKEISKK